MAKKGEFNTFLGEWLSRTIHFTTNLLAPDKRRQMLKIHHEKREKSNRRREARIERLEREAHSLRTVRDDLQTIHDDLLKR